VRSPSRKFLAALETARPLLYSRGCQYALRAVEFLARAQAEERGKLVGQARLARELKIPAASLAQVLHRLRRAGLLNARRGPSGGVSLSRSAGDITVLEVVRAIEGTGLQGRCVLGLDDCTDQAPCPAHPVWKRARTLLELQLERRSLKDLVSSMRRKAARRNTK
jgi:Rrf2 family transcriptional regulator, iron-sulfur cluster assembly transcription factor